MQRQLRCEDYTVGWVCALPVELAAAQLMLDERHLDLKRDPTDNHDHLYVLGSIKGHNVAIGCLPAGQTGNNSAAVVATQMLATFRKIRFGLMVGIGGGVPSASSDVRLGDVVVSQPDGTFGGVVQYDMGKTTIKGFRRTGSLNAPPQTLLSALSTIQANEWLGRSGLANHARRLEGSRFQRSRAGLDVLYEAAYNHKGPQSQTCIMCSADRIKYREPRVAGEEVMVHYGTIASGNKVMKSASERDKASAQLGGVLCFEMEAAGLMNTFPCLVIRGICDYSDTHKNDRWHAYAAGIAAAYAREVLSVIAPVEVAATQMAETDIGQHIDVLTARGNDKNCTVVSPSRLHALNAGPVVDAGFPRTDEAQSRRTSEQPDHMPVLSDEQRKTIRNSLNFKQRDARLLTLRQAQAKTCQWLLKNTKYVDWMHADRLTQHRGFFWIKGKPGSGKSIMMKFLFSHAKKTMRKTLVLSFFFNARGDTLEKTTSGLYRALVLQLLEKAPQAWKAFGDDNEIEATLNLVETSGWQDEVLCQLFIRCLQELGNRRVVCFVDALDECSEDEIRTMVSFFEEIGEIGSIAEFRVCFSSRHYPEISILTGLQLVLEAETEHTDDITAYVDANLKMEDDPQNEDVRAEIVRKASGIFLWVHLVIPILNKEYDTGRSKALKKRLANIPPGLHDLFMDMLTRDQRRLRSFRVSVEIILYAARPLKPDEFRVAVETYCEGSYNPRPHQESAMMTAKNLTKFVLDSSKGLAEITTSKEATVQWIHESVRDFFLKEKGLEKLQAAENSIKKPGHSIYVDLCLQQLDYAIASEFPNAPRLDPNGPPLLQYAVQYILFHANESQKSGADQSPFLERFIAHYKPAWAALYPHYDRTVSVNSHLLYHLCECGADELIRIHPDRASHLEITGDPHHLPLIVALYAGHNSAARALLDLPRSRGISQQSSLPDFALKRENFRKRGHLLTYLCEYGDLDLLQHALFTDCLDSDGLVPQRCFAYAASEAVVVMLVSFLDDTWRLTSQQQFFTGLKHDMETNTILPYLRLNLRIRPQLAAEPALWGNYPNLLTYAASKGFHRIVSLCIEMFGPQGRSSALEAAICGFENAGGRVLVIEQLLHPAYATVQDREIIGDVLPRAICLPQNEEVIRLVLTKSKISLEISVGKGMTPLLWAISHGRKACVKMLLEIGADPAARDCSDGRTALITAIDMSDLNSLKLLLKFPNCRPNAQDKDGWTALSLCVSERAVEGDRASKMVHELLKRADIDPNVEDDRGWTALKCAVKRKNLSMVKDLLSHPDIEPDSGASDKSTPLRTCIRHYIRTWDVLCLDILVELLQIGKASLHNTKKLPTPAHLIVTHLEHFRAGFSEYWRDREDPVAESSFRHKMAMAGIDGFSDT